MVKQRAENITPVMTHGETGSRKHSNKNRLTTLDVIGVKVLCINVCFQILQLKGLA